MSFRFSWVLIFLIIQVALWLYWYFNQKDKNFIFKRASEQVRTTINENIDESLTRWKNRIILVGIAILTFSAAGPQIGTRVRPIERKGVDLVIALDTSISMDAEDVTPSRLDKAKFELGQLIKYLKGDRVAIIVFAGSSHLYLPLTTDYEAAMLFLNEIDTGMIPTQGTVLSSALNTALNAFTDDIDKFRLLLLVSDGEDHDGEAIKLARKAADSGYKINTVGVGSKNGSLIPITSKNGRLTEYKRDNKGKLITSTLNESILKEISIAGNGTFFWFNNNQDSYLDIAADIESMEKKTISTHEFSEYEDRYQFFATMALLFLIIGFVMPTRSGMKN